MASGDPIEVIKMSTDQNGTFEIQRNIRDVTIPSDVEYNQPLSDFTVRFNHQVDTPSSHFAVIISIRSKLQDVTFDVVAVLHHYSTTEVRDQQQNCRQQNCILVVRSACDRKKTQIFVRITYKRCVSAIPNYTTITNKVDVRQTKFSNELYNSRESTGDVTIETASGTKHKAHKLILGTRSPFFKTMFEVDLKERKESMVKIGMFREDLVVGLIEFIYVGWTESVRTNPKGLLQIAHMYQVADVVEACWDRLMENLKVKNAVQLLRWSGKYDDEDGRYKKQVGQFLLKNFETFRKTEEFAAFVKEDADLFVEIFSMNFRWPFTY